MKHSRTLGPALVVAVVLAVLANPRALAANNYQVTALGSGEGIVSKMFGINRYGQAVGWFMQEDGTHHGVHWQNGSIEDLDFSTHFWPGAVFTEHYSEAYDISNSDQIVGTALVAFDCEQGTIISYHAFVHRPATSDGISPYPGDALTDLGAFGPPCFALNSAAVAISNNNHVVGWADEDAAGTTRAFIVVPTGGASYRDNDFDGVNDLMINLGSLGPADGVSSATGVNDYGTVVGWSFSAARGGQSEGYHAFVIVPQDTDADGYGDVWAADINADGANDLMTDLGTLGGTNSWARGINLAGQIVGESDTLDGHTHAFIWENGVMTDLGTLGGGDSSASSINGFGQVVGWAETAAGQRRAFLWEDGVMTDLNAVTPSGGLLRVAEARDINDAGQIAGWAVEKSQLNGVAVACVLDISLGDIDSEGTAAPVDPLANDPGNAAVTSGELELHPLLPSPPSRVLGETNTAGDETTDTGTAACGSGLLGFIPLTALGMIRGRRFLRRR